MKTPFTWKGKITGKEKPLSVSTKGKGFFTPAFFKFLYVLTAILALSFAALIYLGLTRAVV